MKNMIKKLRIQNFKSIQDLELDCSRINVFIGKPNVGKSNILEALSLFGVQNYEGSLSDLVRYETLDNLFFYRDLKESITIDTNIEKLELTYFSDLTKYGLVTSKSKKSIRDFIQKPDLTNDEKVYCQFFDNRGEKGDAKTNIKQSPIKKYVFDKQRSIRNFENKFGALKYPFGKNLPLVIESSKEMREEISDIFKDYNLEFVLDTYGNALEIQKRIDYLATKIPYILIADTLQRIIFHYAAIESNKDAILLFEEPENHSYPPYIKSLAEKIIDSRGNQFFITTHSPYLFNTILSGTKKGELSVFVMDFKNYESTIKKISEEDLREMSNHGTDIFFNLRWFENE